MSDNRGISCLGLCHPKYPVDALINSFSQASVIRFGWLDNFFNPKDSKNAIKVVSFPREKFARVHIINGPGMNNGRTQPHEITYKMSHDDCVKAIKRRDKKFLEKFRARCAHVADVAAHEPTGILQLAVSPWLEHKPMPVQVFKTLAAIVTEMIPQAAIVDNPVSGGFFPGFLREYHGNKAPKNVDIADLDGIDFETVDLQEYAARHQNAKVCYVWGFNDNGLDGKSAWKPPHLRTEWPGSRELKVYQEFVKPSALTIQSPLNSADTKGLKIMQSEDGDKRGFLWKLGDGKGHAVALLPPTISASKVVIKKDGHIVDTGRFRGKYTEDGSNRQIFDFSRHTSDYRHNSVLVADGRFGWVLDLPAFRID